MNKKGTRSTNGEGSIYETIQKIKRKNRLEKMCEICSNCTDMSVCNFREGTKKCQKCKECTDCLKYCDRFYIYKKLHAQITIEGKQITVANATKRKEIIEKKKEIEAKALTKNYIKKNDITLLQVCYKILDEKYKLGKICPNTRTKEMYVLKRIESYDEFNKPIQKVTYEDINIFLNSIRYLSQSEILKTAQVLKTVFNECVINKIIAYSDNPMFRVKIPASYKKKKIVEAFEVDEQKKLMQYLQAGNLANNFKSEYDDKTLKNLFILLFLTGARIGEIGALTFNDVDLKKQELRINNTLTKDEEGNIVLGNITKTGKKKIFAGKIDERYIPFDIFDKKLFNDTIKEQIEVAKQYPNNKYQLLFCQKSGGFIRHQNITNIFKRICRELEIKLDIATGCHVHQCRHSFTTRCIEAGIDTPVIAYWLGHSSEEQIYKTYGHILNKYRNEQSKKSRKYFRNNFLM